VGAALCTLGQPALARVSLPRQACGPQALAWLAGLSSRPAGAGGVPARAQRAVHAGSSAPAGCCPLEALELGTPSPAAASKASGGGVVGDGCGDAELAELLPLCPLLRKLVVQPASGLGGGALAALGQHCLGLTRLRLGGCLAVDGAALAALASALRCLRSVELSGCGVLTDVGVAALAAAQPALLVARLEGCAALTDASAAALAGGCPSLRVLSLARCGGGVTDAAAVAALSSCGDLRTLLLAGCGVAGRFPDAFGCAAFQRDYLGGPGEVAFDEWRGDGKLRFVAVLLEELSLPARAREGLKTASGRTNESRDTLMRRLERARCKWTFDDVPAAGV
jgi:hypothetical protein